MPDNDPRTQAEKFADLARELECDDDEERFAERVRRIVKRAVATPDADPPKSSE